MSDRKEVQFSLKVFINEEKTKVLFAEADNDFVDVLLSFLLLPLANIVKILEKHYGDKAPVIGSLTTLYKGLSHPDTINFWTNLGTCALNPSLRSYGYLGLKVNVDRTMSTFTTTSYGFEQSYDGVFTPNSASFIICDDLRIVPNVTGSVMQTLSKVGVNMTDMHGVEIRTVTFGLKEIAELLKGSLVSHTPLSELILDKRPTKQIRFTTVKSEPGILSHQIEKEEASNSTKMILNVMFQKSTKKLLFAQADNDFVNFLFNILVTPLGRVEWLLASNSGLNNIDNLYRSIADFIDEKHLKDSDKKGQLMKPEVNEMYATQHFLPRRRQSQLRRSFVEGSRMYMITDDLTVTSLVLSSSLSILKEMAIPLSDVEEVELQIGLEEALSILKASLTSSCALTDGLINPKLKKQPMQEH